MGLPKPLLVVAATLFVASVLGALAALVVFFRYDTEFWYYFEVGPVLKGGGADPRRVLRLVGSTLSFTLGAKNRT